MSVNSNPNHRFCFCSSNQTGKQYFSTLVTVLFYYLFFSSFHFNFSFSKKLSIYSYSFNLFLHCICISFACFIQGDSSPPVNHFVCTLFLVISSMRSVDILVQLTRGSWKPLYWRPAFQPLGWFSPSSYSAGSHLAKPVLAAPQSGFFLNNTV